MAFIKFHPCGRCGSRDNLAEYTDGFHCFGCGYHAMKRNLSRFKPLSKANLYDDITLEKTLAIDHLKWLLGYGLSSKECEQFKSCYKKGEKAVNLLVLTHGADYWQARNFGYGVKYLSSGKKPFIVYGQGDVLVLVEDIISAVKVGRQYVAVPMLGSKPASEWNIYIKPYKRVIIWGDRDKARQNVTLSRRLGEWLGKKIEVVISEKDPKEYTDNEIKEFIT